MIKRKFVLTIALVVISLSIGFGFASSAYGVSLAQESSLFVPKASSDQGLIEITVTPAEGDGIFTYRVTCADIKFETEVILNKVTTKTIAVPADQNYTITEIPSGNFTTKGSSQTITVPAEKTTSVTFATTKKEKRASEGAVTNTLHTADQQDVAVSFAYFEQYSDGTYGFHTKARTTIVDDKTIVEDGYCLYDTANLEKSLAAKKGRSVSVTLGKGATDIFDLTYGCVTVDEVRIIKLRNVTAEDAFVDLGGDEAAPAKVSVTYSNLNYAGEEKSICEDAWYNPLFSDTIYFKEAEARSYDSFNIRTPRNLDNIDRVNERAEAADNTTGSNGWIHSEKITYLQTQDLNFADVTATIDADVRFKKDGYFINEVGASLNPNKSGEVVLNCFSGDKYDGCGKKIKNVTIEGSGEIARGVTIFGFNNSRIENCVVENATIKKNSADTAFGVSALVGRNMKGKVVSNCSLGGLVNIESTQLKTAATGGLVAANWNDGSTILNCTVSTTSGSSIKGNSSVGGMVGRSLGDSIVVGCSIKSNAVLEVATTGGGNFIGGLVGENHGTIGGVDDAAACTVAGALTLVGNNIGAIAGTNGFYDNDKNEFSQGTKRMQNCRVTGSLTASGANAGGIVGTNNGTVNGCSVNGPINLDIGTSWYVGGIVGNNVDTIEFCTLGGSATDSIKINAQTYAGGIAGNNGSATVVGVTATIANCEVNSGGVLNISATGEDEYKQSYVGGISGLNSGAISDSHVLGNTKIEGVNYTGGIAGSVSLSASLNLCTVDGGVSVAGVDYVGGISGWSHGTVGDARVLGNTTINGTDCIAGIVGSLSSSAVLNSCAVDGDVSVAGVNYVGGVSGSSHGTINDAQVLGRAKIVGTGLYVGGIAGLMGNGDTTVASVITSGCAVSGDVSVAGTNYVGGITGWNFGVIKGATVSGGAVVSGLSRVGGIAGAVGNHKLPAAGDPFAVYGSIVRDSVSVMGTANESFVGGIAGYNNAYVGKLGQASNQVLGSVQVKGSGYYVGGIAGYNNSVGVIASSSVVGSGSGVDIVGRYYTGGIAGYNNSGVSGEESAILGNGLIDSCKVDGLTRIGNTTMNVCDNWTGGIAGWNDAQLSGHAGTIRNCTVGSATSYIPVSTYYVDPVTSSFTICGNLAISTVENTSGWVEKFNTYGSHGKSVYPSDN